MTVERLDTSPRTKLAAARAVSRLLLPTEEKIDRSIADGSALLQQVVQVRIELGLPVDLVQPALRAAGQSVLAMIEAREAIVKCHASLADVRDSLALKAEDVGCIPGSMSGMSATPLRRAS